MQLAHARHGSSVLHEPAGGDASELSPLAADPQTAADVERLFDLAHAHDAAPPSASQRAFDSVAAASGRHAAPTHVGTHGHPSSSHDGGFLGFGAGFNPYSYTDPHENHRRLDPEVRSLHAQEVRMIVPHAVVTTGLLGAVGADYEQLGLEHARAQLAAHPQNPIMQREVANRQKQYALDTSFVRSFERTLELAGKHATINLTFCGGTDQPAHIDLFASIVRHLIGMGYTGLQVTLENEPNGFDRGDGFRGHFDHGIQHHQPGEARAAALEYVHAYQRLDAALSDRGKGDVRARVEVVGGDMVENYRRQFFGLITKLGLNRYVDAYSFHIYWGARPGGLARALHDLVFVHQLAHQLAPGKALQLTEYGKEHRTTAAERKRDGNLGVDGTERGVVPAFEQGLFALSAVNDGYVGLVKWDAFYGYKNSRHIDPHTHQVVPDQRGNYGSYFMIGGPGHDYRPDATYRLMRMFTHAVEPGWRCDGSNRGTTGAEVHFHSADGRQGAILAMNQQGESIATGGMPAQGPLHVVIWNADGNGGLRMHTVAHGGIVRVPAGGAIAVSTKAFT
jgi:hypothetical protein